MENEFYRHYKERVVPALKQRHKYGNVHQVPRIEKVVVNTSVGSQQDIKQAMEEAKAELMAQFDVHECIVKAHADPANE